MKIIELIIDETNEDYGVEAISVVENPAIEIDFVALKKHEVLLKADEEKKILLGAGLVPNKQIYRFDESIGEYYIWFSKDTIRKASELFLKSGNQSNATFEHERDIEGMVVVESWIVENPEIDKAKLYGFDVPEGTWMLSMKCENSSVWEEVKTKNVKGFSIEGHFADKVDMKKALDKDNDLKVLQKVKEIINEYEKNNKK